MSEEIVKSKSALKREERRKEIKAAKKKASFGRLIEVIIGIAIAAVFVVAVVLGIWYSIDVTTESTEFSACLTDEGYILGADLSTVKDLGLESLVVPASEVEMTDEEVASEIESVVDGYSYKDDTVTKAIETGDTVYIDFTGYIGDVAFEGGTGEDYELEIGSGTFIDNFEDQLVGHVVGDNFDVNVTFPENYGSADLANQAARFDVTVKGFKAVPEFNDDFVKENLSEDASTADEYREFVKANGLHENLESYLTAYIEDNASVSKYPKAYAKEMRSLQLHMDKLQMEYMNNYYYYMMGYTPYAKLSDYTGAEGRAYEVQLKKNSKKAVAINMTYESVFKNAGLEVSEDDYNELVGSYGEEEYGKPYIMQQAIHDKVIHYLLDKVTVQ